LIEALPFLLRLPGVGVGERPNLQLRETHPSLCEEKKSKAL